MLRARFELEGGIWSQRVSTTAEDSYGLTSHSVTNEEEEVVSVQRAAHAGIDIRRGPVFAVDLLTLGTQQMIHLVAHHLVIDLVSWRIILQDLEQLLQDEHAALPRPGLSFRLWCQLQRDHMRSIPTRPDERASNINVSSDCDFWGMVGMPNLHGDTVSERFSLDKATTSRIMTDCNVALDTEPLDIMLTALAASFHHAFPDRPVPTIFNEGHGRESWDPAVVDPNNTVGWFTTLSPITVTLDGNRSFADILRQMKDARRQTRDSGTRYLDSLSRRNVTGVLEESSSPEVIFNYAGRYQQLEHGDALFRPLSNPGAFAAQIGPSMRRFALIEVSVTADEEQLHFELLYNRHMQRRSQIRDIMNTYHRLLDSCSTELLQSLTLLSRFPLLEGTTEDLDHLMSRVQRTTGLAPEDIEDVYPCTPMQERILNHQTESAWSYNVQNVWKVGVAAAGAPRADCLEAAWQQVVDRHPALRTIFPPSDGALGRSHQVVLRRQYANVEIFHTALDDGATLELLTELPALRFSPLAAVHQLTICTSATGSVYMKLQISHAVIDGFSFLVVLRDIQLAYSTQLTPGPGPSYRHFVNHTVRGRHGESRAYWERYLSGLSPCILPVSTSKRDSGGDLRSVEVPLAGMAGDLYELSRRLELTVANIFMVAWALVLHHTLSRSDVVFGYLVAGRDVPVDGVEDAVGLYINLIPCHISISHTNSLQDLLEAVREDFVSSLPHQHVAHANITSGPQAGSPLFNTAVSYQKDSAPAQDSTADAGLVLQRLWSRDPTEVCRMRKFETKQR
jgi:non-ribosomal peptide synthase protein (TIGR01720 family)